MLLFESIIGKIFIVLAILIFVSAILFGGYLLVFDDSEVVKDDLIFDSSVLVSLEECSSQGGQFVAVESNRTIPQCSVGEKFLGTIADEGILGVCCQVKDLKFKK